MLYKFSEIPLSTAFRYFLHSCVHLKNTRRYRFIWLKSFLVFVIKYYCTWKIFGIFIMNLSIYIMSCRFIDNITTEFKQLNYKCHWMHIISNFFPIVFKIFFWASIIIMRVQSLANKNRVDSSMIVSCL